MIGSFITRTRDAVVQRLWAHKLEYLRHTVATHTTDAVGKQSRELLRAECALWRHLSTAVFDCRDLRDKQLGTRTESISAHERVLTTILEGVQCRKVFEIPTDMLYPTETMVEYSAWYWYNNTTTTRSPHEMVLSIADLYESITDAVYGGGNRKLILDYERRFPVVTRINKPLTEMLEIINDL